VLLHSLQYTASFSVPCIAHEFGGDGAHTPAQQRKHRATATTTTTNDNDGANAQ
jgi:hypothetical protein